MGALIFVDPGLASVSEALPSPSPELRAFVHVRISFFDDESKTFFGSTWRGPLVECQQLRWKAGGDLARRNSRCGLIPGTGFSFTPPSTQRHRSGTVPLEDYSADIYYHSSLLGVSSYGVYEVVVDFRRPGEESPQLSAALGWGVFTPFTRTEDPQTWAASLESRMALPAFGGTPRVLAAVSAPFRAESDVEQLRGTTLTTTLELWPQGPAVRQLVPENWPFDEVGLLGLLGHPLSLSLVWSPGPTLD